MVYTGVSHIITTKTGRGRGKRSGGGSMVGSASESPRKRTRMTKKQTTPRDLTPTSPKNNVDSTMKDLLLCVSTLQASHNRQTSLEDLTTGSSKDLSTSGQLCLNSGGGKQSHYLPMAITTR